MIVDRRLTIRTRLTLWYVVTFFLTGAVLLTLVYVLVDRTLVRSDNDVAVTLAIRVPTGSEVKPALPVSAPTSGPASASASGMSRPAGLEVVRDTLNHQRGRTLRTVIFESAGVFAVLTIIAMTACWLIASRMLRPLRRVTAVADRLSHDTLDERIAHDGPADELKTLTVTFNRMLDRLGRAFAAQRLFAANASHELRTPLTIIQTAAERALSRPHRTEPEYRTALEIITTAAHRSERLLGSLLALAQISKDGTRQRIDLAERARDGTSAWPRDAPRLVADLATAPLHADPVLVDLLLRNLLENAVHYNQPDGTVWIETGIRGDAAYLEVANTGPLVAAADLPDLHRPFRRGSQRVGKRAGHGLGLAIVDAVVAAHDGHWWPAARPDGGLTVTVTLPREAGSDLTATRPPVSRPA